MLINTHTHMCLCKFVWLENCKTTTTYDSHLSEIMEFPSKLATESDSKQNWNVTSNDFVIVVLAKNPVCIGHRATSVGHLS